MKKTITRAKLLNLIYERMQKGFTYTAARDGVLEEYEIADEETCQDDTDKDSS